MHPTKRRSAATQPFLEHQSRTPRRPDKTYLRIEKLEPRDVPSSGYFFTQATNTGIIPNASMLNDSVSWLDFNGDGRPDLWIGGELEAPQEAVQPPNLYINNGDGTFTDAFSTVFPPNNPLTRVNDAEGSVWGDFFNTGSPDFLQISGGTGGKHYPGSYFYVNNQGQLTNEALAQNLTNISHGGRQDMLLDWNHDGLLDNLFLNYSGALSQTLVLYQQTPTGFRDVTAQSGLAESGINNPVWAQSVDLNGDGVPDLLIGPSDLNGSPPVYYHGNVGSPGYTLVPNFIPNIRNITDVAVGDFFNNGYNDIFFTRRIDTRSDVEQGGPNQIGAQLIGRNNGFTFQSTGTLSLDFDIANYGTNNILPTEVYVGSQGYNPSTVPFTLDPTDRANQGIAAPTGHGIYIGYDSASQSWQVYNGAHGQLGPIILNMSQPVSNLTPVGFDPNAQALSPVLLVYNPTQGKFVDMTAQAGLSAPIAGGSVVAGDFNNDGRLDLYVSNETRLADKGGILYLNNGNGTFTAVPGTPSFPGVYSNDVENKSGRRAVTADYLGNGMLDLFTPNTMFRTPNQDYYAAPNALWYNAPNGNNWVEFNLQGVESNRDALGAVVYLTSGGVTQRRDVTGGNHTAAQDSNIVHFGLGHSTTIDQVVIDWPSGIVQTLNNVPIDQLQTITEPGGHSMTQARPVGTSAPNLTYNGTLVDSNTPDFYTFSATGISNIQLTVSGQVQIQLLDHSGNVLGMGSQVNGQASLNVLVNAGTYYLEVTASQPGQGIGYALTFDVVDASPAISNLTVTPLADAAPPITVKATASLLDPQGRTIGAAEFFVDITGANGTGVPMAAQDGSFDQSSEVVTGTIDGSLWNSLSVHHHGVFVHAMDNLGNWGPFVSLVFLKDNEGPFTAYLAVNPPLASHKPTITAVVNDSFTGVSKIAAAEYFIDTPGATGTGFAMALNQTFDGGAIRDVSAVMPANVFNKLRDGQHTIFVRGEDILGNWGGFASVTFTVTAPGAAFRLAFPLGGTVAGQRPADHHMPDTPAVAVSSPGDVRKLPGGPAPPRADQAGGQTRSPGTARAASRHLESASDAFFELGATIGRPKDLESDLEPAGDRRSRTAAP
jgi:hypothetical protein